LRRYVCPVEINVIPHNAQKD